MTFGAEIWGPPLIQAAGSIAGGMLGGGGQGETKIQKRQRKLIDQLMASLGGEGPFSNLFATDEAAFQKSFVEPAQKMFRNQIAPGIQQSFIAGGQQRGTGLDDQLLRAGVDLDSLLNQHYLSFQNQGKDRMQNSIGQILGAGAGAHGPLSTGQTLGQSAAGFLSSDSFGDLTKDLFKKQANTTAQSGAVEGARAGYTEY